MSTHDALLPATVLQRQAVVYVRQSTPQQVQSNLESQRRQYELVDVAGGQGGLVELHPELLHADSGNVDHSKRRIVPTDRLASQRFFRRRVDGRRPQLYLINVLYTVFYSKIMAVRATTKSVQYCSGTGAIGHKRPPA